MEIPIGSKIPDRVRKGAEELVTDSRRYLLSPLERKYIVCSICGDPNKEVLTIGNLNPNVGPFCRECYPKWQEARELSEIPPDNQLTYGEVIKLRKLLDRFEHLLGDLAPDQRFQAMNQ